MNNHSSLLRFVSRSKGSPGRSPETRADKSALFGNKGGETVSPGIDMLIPIRMATGQNRIVLSGGDLPPAGPF